MKKTVGVGLYLLLSLQHMELKVSKIFDIAENALPVVDYRKNSIIAKSPLTSPKIT